jgi:outer membrane autotransporter protein
VNSRYLLLSALLLFKIGELGASGSGIGPAYVVSGSAGGKVYSVDLQTGAYSEVVAITGADLSDIAVLNASTAYAIDYANGNFYSIDTQQKQYHLINSLESGFYSLQILNKTTAVAANYDQDGVYEIDLSSGTSRLVATVPGSPGLLGLAIAGNNLVYVDGYDDSNVYAVNLKTGESTLITPTPLPGVPEPWGAAIENSPNLYVAGDTVDNVFNVDLSNGSSTLISPIDIGSNGISGVALSDNIAYVTGFSGDIFAVNLLDGTYSLLATIPSVEFYGIGLWLQIPTTGLSGNNLKLAKYLNANGSFDNINSLAFLGSGLEAGLAAVSPLRNSLSTFAAQNAQMASSQTLIDHMHLKRLERLAKSETETVVSAIEQNWEEYLAGPIQPPKEEPREQSKRSSYSVWGTPFGEYAKGKGKGQLPNFDAGLGGIVVGFDFNSEQGNSVGVGGAYVYTHLHEGSGSGNANINQGYLTVFGEVIAQDWYIDLALWGGYFASRNVRNIRLPFVNETAKATIRGWQLTPHFEVGYDGFLSKTDQNKWLGVEPFLLADWVAVWQRGYKESGAGSFDMGENSKFCSLFRGETGLRLLQVAHMSWGQIFFTEKGSYAYQKAFKTGKVTAFVVGSPGSFTVEALQQAQNLGVVEVSFLFSPKSSKIPYFDLRYQGEFGSRYQSHQGMLEIGKTF